MNLENGDEIIFIDNRCENYKDRKLELMYISSDKLHFVAEIIE